MDGKEIAVQEQLVQTTDLSPGVLQVTMQDLQGKNALSEAFVKQLLAVFALISQREDLRVVVLTGAGPYFCTGGTKDTLLAIHQRRFRFTDTDLYRVAIDCPVPVIAAMQGHALGGGLVLGLGADINILAAERVYSANFMRYGFTPGMGATCILPDRFGESLAREMLLSGASYRGVQLRERGVTQQILPSSQVLARAVAMAEEMAQSPRVALCTLKKHLLGTLLARFPATIKSELEMHELTFHHPDVQARIEEHFGSKVQM